MDDEELRRLTLAGNAKLSLGSTQTDELDDNVLAGKIISIVRIAHLSLSDQLPVIPLYMTAHPFSVVVQLAGPSIQ
jgi:hypothetical protein